MPRIALITGVTGQDGSYLAERLLTDEWEVHALVRGVSADGEHPVDPRVVRHVGDLTDTRSVGHVMGTVSPDLVVNLAAISSVAASWEEPVATAEINGVAVVSLLDAAWRLQETEGKPVRFVQASSAEIFGAASDVPQNESTAIRPVSPYGAAKALAHHAVGVYRARGLFAASGILYNHESPRRPASFVTRKITQGVARVAAGLEDSLSLGNLDAVRDWGWAPDYVDALLRIGAADRPNDYVVATGVAHTVRDFVAAAFAAAGIDDWEPVVRVDERFVRPNDAPEMRGDASRIKADLGWAPTIGFDEIVARMVRHDLQQIA